MSHITKVARLLLAILVAAMVIRSTFMTSSLFMTLFFVALVISVIPAPSDKAMLRRLESFYDDTVRHAGEACDMLHFESVLIFKAFLGREKFNFCRRVNNTTVIYMHAAGVAFVEKSGKKLLVIGTKSLVSGRPAKFYTVDLHGDPIKISSREEEDSVEVLIECKTYPKGFLLLAKNDFRYRDFMEAMKDYVA
ncbi:MAG: hypothetical protein IJW16_02450 [Clostridia bacterium]|nr:hypothetical protein [Clostridia bacterium]